MAQIKEKTKELIKKLPAQKHHLDFIGALLTIPVLITVLILNLVNLNKKPTAVTISPTPTPKVTQAVTPKVIYAVTSTPTTIPSVTQPACNANIGPISIASPTEGQTTSNNPVCIDINYQGDGYCGVVWAYQINNGPLSDYSNNSVCLYNLPSGTNVFVLQVKSLVSQSQETLRRTFIYNGGSTNNPTPTAAPQVTPTPTPAATVTP